MPEYIYTALTADGDEKKDNIIAESEDAALESIRLKGLYPVEIKKATVLNKEIEFTIGQAVSARDLSVFCRQLVSMLTSGVTIVMALEMLANQTENKHLAKTLKTVEQDILKGETLADAMSRHPKIFPELMINMVNAGEQSGKLEITFKRMAAHFEKAAKTKGMIRKASVYPIVVAVVSVVVVIIMLVKVIPSYKEMFNSLDTELPMITQVVVGLSDGLVKYWYLILAAIVGIVALSKAINQTPDGKFAQAKMSLKIPLFGKLRVKTACSVIARTLSTLIFSGMTLVDSLQIVSKVADNEVYRRALMMAAEDVKKGIPLSTSLKKSNLFPPMVEYMVGIGEETGELEDMLSKLADYYDEEVDMATQTVMAAIEPMIILIMAGLVGVLIAAVMSPMIGLYSNLGNL